MNTKFNHSIADIKAFLGKPEDLIFQAVGCATDPACLDLLDTMVAGDDVKFSKILKDTPSLMTGDFGFYFRILVVTIAPISIVKALMGCGYDLNYCPPSPAGKSSTFNTMAIQFCGLERQRELLECGFLSAHRSSDLGMKCAAPEIFDFWQKHYADSQYKQKQSGSASPRADETIGFWMAQSEGLKNSNPGGVTHLRLKEFHRRFEVMTALFFEVHYPADSEQERWLKMLERPFSVPSPYSENEKMLATLIKFQQDRTPGFKDFSVPVLDIHSEANVAFISLLLSNGYELSDFQQDLAGDVLLRAAVVARKPPEGLPRVLDALWEAIKPKVVLENPDLVDRLPSELFKTDVTLRSIVSGEGSSRMAFAELVELSLATNAAAENKKRKGMRL